MGEKCPHLATGLGGRGAVVVMLFVHRKLEGGWGGGLGGWFSRGPQQLQLNTRKSAGVRDVGVVFNHTRKSAGVRAGVSVGEMGFVDGDVC